MIGAVLAPTPPVQGFISGDQFVCSGLSVNIGLQEYSGFIQWQESPDGLTNWANVSSGSGSNSATYITPSLNVITYYRVEVTQPTFAPVYSNVTTVQVLPSPGEAGPITGDEFICQGQGDVLYVVEEIANATSYVWSLPFGATGSSNTNSILVNFGTTSSGGEISVAGVNDLCVGESSSLYAVSLEEHSPLVAEVIQPTCTVATGSATIFDLPDYGWTLTLLPDGLIVIGIGFHFTFENLPAGTYQFSVEDEFGCLSMVTPEFTIDPQPAIPPTPVVSAIDNILHSDSPTGNQWYDANGPIPGATDQDYVALVDGDYYVVVTLNECASSPSNSVNIIISSTEVVGEKMKAYVYPNPVSDQLILEIPGNTNLISYEIHDAFGVLVIKGEVATKSSIDTKQLVPGVYFVQIGNTGLAAIRKFVKE